MVLADTLPGNHFSPDAVVLHEFHDDNAFVFLLILLDVIHPLVGTETLVQVRLDFVLIVAVGTFDVVCSHQFDATLVVFVVVDVDGELEVAVDAAVVAPTLLVLLDQRRVVGDDGDQPQAVRDVFVVQRRGVLFDGD